MFPNSDNADFSDNEADFIEIGECNTAEITEVFDPESPPVGEIPTVTTNWEGEGLFGDVQEAGEPNG
jgi:hypothetical protein